jgi:hypothetical protein
LPLDSNASFWNAPNNPELHGWWSEVNGDYFCQGTYQQHTSTPGVVYEEDEVNIGVWESSNPADGIPPAKRHASPVPDSQPHQSQETESANSAPVEGPPAGPAENQEVAPSSHIFTVPDGDSDDANEDSPIAGTEVLAADESWQPAVDDAEPSGDDLSDHNEVSPVNARHHAEMGQLKKSYEESLELLARDVRAEMEKKKLANTRAAKANKNLKATRNECQQLKKDLAQAQAGLEEDEELKGKLTAVEARIAELESQLIEKDQANGRLVNEHKRLYDALDRANAHNQATSTNLNNIQNENKLLRQTRTHWCRKSAASSENTSTHDRVSLRDWGIKSQV